MGQCTSCGADVAEHELDYRGGMPVCIACMSSGATTNDKACSRCGVYIPAYELKMYKSRLFCNYCIMDMMDEDERQAKITSERARQIEVGGQPPASEKIVQDELTKKIKEGESPQSPDVGANRPHAQPIKTTETKKEERGFLFNLVQKVSSKVAERLIDRHIEAQNGVKMTSWIASYPLSLQEGGIGKIYAKLDSKSAEQIRLGLMNLQKIDDKEYQLGKKIVALSINDQLRALRAMYFAHGKGENGLTFERALFAIKEVNDGSEKNGKNDAKNQNEFGDNKEN